MKETTIYKNAKGNIVKFEESRFGSVKYILFDSNNNYVKDIPNTFKVSDYL